MKSLYEKNRNFANGLINVAREKKTRSVFKKKKEKMLEIERKNFIVEIPQINEPISPWMLQKTCSVSDRDDCRL